MKWLSARELVIAAMWLVPLDMPAQDDKGLIEYSVGVGQVRLGMLDKDAEAKLGSPTSSSAADGVETEVWSAKKEDPSSAQTVIVFKLGKRKRQWLADEIVVTSAFFHTKGGVSVRSEPAAVWQEFPDLCFAGEGDAADGTHLEMYDSRSVGVAFLFEHDKLAPAGTPWGICRGIIVHRAGQDASFVPLVVARSTGK